MFRREVITRRKAAKGESGHLAGSRTRACSKEAPMEDEPVLGRLPSGGDLRNHKDPYMLGKGWGGMGGVK